MNLNTLKDEKREDCCFVEEEEAIVLSSQVSRAPFAQARHTAQPDLLSLGA